MHTTAAHAGGRGGRASGDRMPGRHRRIVPHRFRLIAGAGAALAVAVTVVAVLLLAGPHHSWPHAFCGPVIGLLASPASDAAYQASMSALSYPQAHRLLADQQAFERDSQEAAGADSLTTPASPAPALEAGQDVSRDLAAIAAACSYRGRLDADPHAGW